MRGEHGFDVLPQSAGSEKEGRAAIARGSDQLDESGPDLRCRQRKRDHLRLGNPDRGVDALDDRPGGELPLEKELLLQGEVIRSAEMPADLVTDVEDRRRPVEVANHRQISHGALVSGGTGQAQARPCRRSAAPWRDRWAASRYTPGREPDRCRTVPGSRAPE